MDHKGPIRDICGRPIIDFECFAENSLLVCGEEITAKKGSLKFIQKQDLGDLASYC
jgi:hypothetical protein